MRCDAAHRELIGDFGHVWYGKLGAPVSAKTAKQILKNDDPRILLIHSGGQDRWWLHVKATQRVIPPLNEIPAYHRSKADDFGFWFKVKSFEPAAEKAMSQCTVVSSGKLLTFASRHNMSPHFIIDFLDGE